jgi:hypothetical protein
LADNTGSFCQSTICYRETFSKNIKNDKHYIFYLNESQLDNETKNFLKDKEVISKKTSLKELSSEKLEKADFITANGNPDTDNDILQEQELFRLLISQIYCAISAQKKNGTFICKFFETFTKTSIKLISLLSFMYDKVYFIKPLMSRLSSSERYIVCMNFNDSKSKDKILKGLNTMIKEYKENTLKIVDIYSNLEIPQDIINSVVNMNVNISNYQFKSINQIIAFVKKEIYFGEEYHLKREQQIEGSKYWINLFLPKEIKKDVYKNIITHVITSDV